MRVRVCVLFLSHEEKKEKRESAALFVCADFLFRIFFHLLVVWRSLRQQEKRDRPVHKKRKERKESFRVGFEKARLLGRRRRRRRSLYIFIREEDGAAITA